jgi:hypothetical protein
MVQLADQPAEIGFCDFTKAKRVKITLRSACGVVPRALRTLRLHHGRLIVGLGSVWGCQLPRASGIGGHGRCQRHLDPDQRRWDYTACVRAGQR